MSVFYPKVYISVLNWNGWEKTAKCIDSLLQSDYHNYVILVVDNHSSDDSVSQLRAIYPTLEIITSPTNLGYAGGNRLALDGAIQDNADLFWILNNDCEVNRDTLGSLVDAYIEHGDALYGSITIYTEAEHRMAKHIHFALTENRKPDFERRLIQRGSNYDQLLETSDSDCIDVANLVGNSLMVPISVIRQHGFINEEFFLYCEDWDYSFRLGRCNVPSRLVLSSLVTHEERASYKEKTMIDAVVMYYRVRNDLIILKNYARRGIYLQKLALQLRRIRKHIFRWMKDQVRARCLLPFPPQLKYQIHGVIDGILGKMGKIYAPEDYI